MLEIYLEQLNKGPNKWECTNISELIIGQFISRQRGWIFHGQTFGNNPEYDYMLNDKKVEQKISRAFANPDDAELKFGIIIEYGRVSGKDSGIALSKSDLYVCLTPGFNYDINNKCGKLRIFETQKLKNHIEHLKGNQIFDKIFQTNDSDGGSRCIIINSKNVVHDWVADVAAIFDKDHIIGYDFNNVLRIN